MIFLWNWVIFRFQPLICQGVSRIMFFGMMCVCVCGCFFWFCGRLKPRNDVFCQVFVAAVIFEKKM